MFVNTPSVGAEVYHLFDDVMVLSEGHIIYHGVREEVRSILTSLCPKGDIMNGFQFKCINQIIVMYCRLFLISTPSASSSPTAKKWRISCRFVVILRIRTTAIY